SVLAIDAGAAARALIGARLGRVDSLPPCGGGSGWGVVPRGTAVPLGSTPTPDPSPQGRGGVAAATLGPHLTPMAGALALTAAPRARRAGQVPRGRRPPAGGEVPRLDFRKRRLGYPAGVDGKGAARMEAAAVGKIERARHHAIDRRQAVLLGVQLRDRAEQSDGIGMLRVSEERRDR